MSSGKPNTHSGMAGGCLRAVTHYNDAVESIQQGKFDYALLSIRKSLEAITRDVSEKCGLPTTENARDIDLERMIDNLKETDLYTQGEISLLHMTRKEANKGAHDRSEPTTLYEAQTALELMQEVLKIFANRYDSDVFSQKATENNIYMCYPNYYSNTRKYYGLWWNCYTREAIEAIPEYKELKQKADAEDISAMLDIAVGFLPKQIVWSHVGLVCMPKYRDRDGNEFFQEDAFDARYYYWILKASTIAQVKLLNNEEIPRKYMLTASLEAAKFQLYANGNINHVSTGLVRTTDDNFQFRYENQYIMAEQMFGGSFSDILGPVDGTLLTMFLVENVIASDDAQIDIGDFLASVHQERNALRIKYLNYCFFYLCQIAQIKKEYKAVFNDDFPSTVAEAIAISPNDIGLAYKKPLLEKYIDDPVCKQHYMKTCEVEQKIKFPPDKSNMLVSLVLFVLITFCMSTLDAPNKNIFVCMWGGLIAAGIPQGWNFLARLGLGNSFGVVIQGFGAVLIGWVCLIINLVKMVCAKFK